MSDDPKQLDDRLTALRAAGGNNTRAQRRPLPLSGVLTAIVLGLSAVAAIFFFDQGQRTGEAALGTSSAQAFQEGSPLGAISIPKTPAPEVEVLQPIRIAATPQPAVVVEDDGKFEQLQQAMLDMQRKLDSQKGGTDPNIDRLLREMKEQNRTLREQLNDERATHQQALKDQTELMRAQFEGQVAALEARLAAQPVQQQAVPAFDPQAERLEAERRRLEAEEARRIASQEADKRAALEKRRKEAKELADRQINAPAVVFDEGAAGLAGASASDGSTGAGRPANANEAFIAAVGSEQADSTAAKPIADPGHTIVEGTFVQGVLETAIDSSLPGGIRAAVAEDVWSFDGTKVLFPKGTRLIGTYRSDLSLAQERALVVWTRAVTPKGLSVQLASTGTDRIGRAGVSGVVDTHFWERFGSAALISLIGAVPELAASASGADDVSTETISDVGDDFRSGTSSVLAEYLSIKPTIHVDQGDQITVFVGQDLVVRGS